jgi:hypothetical protein
MSAKNERRYVEDERLKSATYLDRLGLWWGRHGRDGLERAGWIREGMDDETIHQMAQDKLTEHLDLLDANGALDWKRTPAVRQQVFIDAWIRGFNKLSR